MDDWHRPLIDERRFPAFLWKLVRLPLIQYSLIGGHQAAIAVMWGIFWAATSGEVFESKIGYWVEFHVFMNMSNRGYDMSALYMSYQIGVIWNMFSKLI